MIFAKNELIILPKKAPDVFTYTRKVNTSTVDVFTGAVLVVMSDCRRGYFHDGCDHKHRSCVYGSRSGNSFCRSGIHN